MNSKTRCVLKEGLYLFFAVIDCLLSFAFIFDTFSLGLTEAIYNLALLLPLIGFAFISIRKPVGAVFFSTAVVFILFYLDEYIYAARLTHIRLSDFQQVAEAVRVANRYKMLWNADIVRRFLMAILLCCILVIVTRNYRLHVSKIAVFEVGIVFVTIGAALFFFGVFPHNPETFDYVSDAEKNGLIYSWYCQYHESKLVEPEGYSKERAESLLSFYTPTEGDTDIHLIVIMNESLADYSLLGEPSFKDPLVNLHGYDDNYFYGKLAVSVFGGGTCNTEYEFLTGNSMAFLPDGAMPYLQYVTDKENSIAWDIRDLNQDAIAIHPYYSEEWNRTQVYRYLGFDDFISGADFGKTVVTGGMKATSLPTQNLISFGDGPLYVRGLISDQSCYERILEESAKHSFVFAVTMQNHGGYEYDGNDFINYEYITEDIANTNNNPEKSRSVLTLQLTADDNGNEISKVNQYLTCTQLSDLAFKKLTDELTLRGQKTIVLMFGDHQPSLPIPNKYVDVTDFTETLFYDVPYLMWANFDMEFDAPEYTSPNYLSTILKKNAGLPLTDWDQFRLDMMARYPVVTFFKALDSDYHAVNLAELNDYAVVQYMRMFDE